MSSQTLTMTQGTDDSSAVLHVQCSLRERPAFRERLGRLGLSVTSAGDVPEALRLLAEKRFTLGVLDLADDRAALASIRVLRAQYPLVPLVGVIDPANPVAAAEAIHAGAADLLPWPFDERDLSVIVANARDRLSQDPSRGVSRAASTSALFAQSPAMRQVMELVRLAAAMRQGICISGEPGTGRELVARAIHTLGGGEDDTFIRVDCANQSPQDLETRLFGVSSERRDASSGMTTERIVPGAAVHDARGGTLLLMNLPEAPARVQARLARLLRDREATLADRRVIVDLDIRPIAAVEPGFETAIGDGRLRQDLAERISHVRIDVPPLRRRREDIPLLAVHFLRHLCERHKIPVKSFSRSALTLLAALPWQGNSGELLALLETLVRSVRRSVIQLDDLLEHASLDGIAARIDSGVTLRDAKARFERECITAVLMRHHGRVGEAAKALGIQRTNLYRKVRQLNVARTLLSARK